MAHAAGSSSLKPSVFIGSSSEGLDFARAIRSLLTNDAEVTLWNEGVFPLGATFIEALVTALERFDFAILVLTPDDFVVSRDVETFGPRDNVIFELGLFMGRLGRARTFVVHQSGAHVKIPTDLSGVTTATYQWPRSDNNHSSAVGSACDAMRKIIKELGFSEAKTSQQLAAVRHQVAAQEERIERQQEIINQLVIYSMSAYIYNHLRELYHRKRSQAEYRYHNNEFMRRDMHYLRDHGYIKGMWGDVEFDQHLDGQNLIDVIELTPVGNFYVELRERYEAGTA